MRISIGNGGWVRVSGIDQADAYVRFADRDNRLEPVELYLGAPISTTALRNFPIADVERFAASPKVAERIRYSMGMLRAAALEIEQLRQDLADASTKSRGHPLDFLFGGIFGPRS